MAIIIVITIICAFPCQIGISCEAQCLLSSQCQPSEMMIQRNHELVGASIDPRVPQMAGKFLTLGQVLWAHAT